MMEMNNMSKEVQIRPKQVIKRGRKTYHYDGTFETRYAADFATHYAWKGTGCDTLIIPEAITKKQTMLEKLVLGKVPVQHVYHAYVTQYARRR